MARRKLLVCVVGAGVVGLSVSLHLLERFSKEVDLTLLAERFSPNVVSDKATGIFIYSDLGVHSDQDKEDSKRWFSTSLKKIQCLFSSTENSQIGISLTPGYMFFKRGLPNPPWWKDLMFGFRKVELGSAEANCLSVPSDCTEIWSFSTYTLTPTLYLKWLMNRVETFSCKIKQAKVSDLHELTHTYDVVINCTGLGSKELVADSKMYPIRGQYILVRAPWIKHWLLYEDYGDLIIVPRTSDVVLGATVEVGNWTESTDEEVISEITKTCQNWIPSLAGSEFIGAFAGLRPGRVSIRLEECLTPNGRSLVHCYGHGGKGIILSWGCAVEIGDLLEKKIQTLQIH